MALFPCLTFFLPPSSCLPFVPCTVQAHDLKTPLHSIMGEADFLRQTVTSSCIEIIAAASTESPVALISTLTLHLSSETEELFDNVVSMIQLLTMSINRTQDFVKITSEISLVPELGSFVLEDVLRMVEKCMASQNCDRTVNTHPLVRLTALCLYTERSSLHLFSSDHHLSVCLPVRLLCPFLVSDSRRTSARSSPPTASTCLTTCSVWSRTQSSTVPAGPLSTYICGWKLAPDCFARGRFHSKISSSSRQASLSLPPSAPPK
jgi:hypothetical protein